MEAVKSRWCALGALVLSVLVVGLDGTVLNVALATLAKDLGATTGQLQWIVAVYLVTFSVLLLPAGMAADRWGRKNLLLAGVGLFGASSVLAAFAGSAEALIAARAVMGVGAAIIMPVSMSILPTIFPAEERTRAISIWSVGLALGLPLGPILGGWLLENYWWGSVFLINAPVAVVAIAAIALLIPESRDRDGSKLDPVSLLLSVSGLGLLVYGVIEAPERGWGDAIVLTCIGAGLMLLIGFTARNLRGTHQIDLMLFKNRTFAWGTAATVVASLALMGVLFVVPLRLQGVDGYNALETGIRLIPLILGIMITGKLAPKLTKRLGYRATIAAGLVVMAAGFGLGIFSDEYPYVAAWLTMAGMGLGMAMIPAMDAVLATIPPAKTGTGSGLVQTLRQVAGAFGVAGLGSLLNSVYVARAPEAARSSIVAAAELGDPVLLAQAQAAFASGMDAVLLVCAVGSLVGAGLVAALMRESTPEPAAEAVLQESEYDRVA